MGRGSEGRRGRRVLLGGLVALAVLAGVYLFLVMPGEKAGSRLAAFEQVPIAHRGLYDNAGDAPENSLRAFQKAIDAGYAIELDTQLTADGTVVVSHDNSQLRVSGVDKTLGQLSDEEVAALRLFGTEQGIPTFQEVLDLIDGQVPLLVEIKVGAGGNAPALSAATAALLDAYDGPYVVQSFNPFALQWFKDNRPDVLRGKLAADFPNFEDPDAEDPPTGIMAVALANLWTNFLDRPNFISYEVGGFGQPTFAMVRALTGIDCLAWTIRDEAGLAQAREVGADGVIFGSFQPPLG